MPEWTTSQKRVIESNANEIICSAAAGSGKTAVLVERIVRFLKDGADPESFLIMTFTNAAAAEMKEKIRNRLFQKQSNSCAKSALDKIDLIQISTIHAFCQQLIRNQFQMLEIDPNFQICDTSQRKKIFHEAFSDACEELQKENHPDYELVKKRFEIKKAEELIQNLEPFLMSLPEPFDWMKSQIDSIPTSINQDHPWFNTIRSMAEDQLRMAELDLSSMYAMFSDSFALESYREVWKADAELFHVKQSEIMAKPENRKPAEFEKMKVIRGLTVQESDWKDRYQKLRKDYKEKINSVDNLLLTDAESTIQEWQNMKESLQAIYTLMTQVENAFQIKKRARSLLDFQDLEQYAVQILSDPMGREEAHATWRYIFVDECQDNSAVQNRIISLLQDRENHLFMVGDVKQSIYRFRLADPLLFMERIEKCRNQSDMDRECIYLQSNFRSRPEILETTNQVFRSIMKKNVTEVEYGPEEELIPGRRVEGTEPVQIIQIDKADLDWSDLEATADFIQDEIKTLLQTAYGEKKRNYQYRDCVILMPAVQHEGPVLAELLTQRGIPVFFDGGGDYYQLKEVQMIRNLLEWIDYPLQDLPLLSVLQEPPFSFSAEELSLVRLKHPEKEVSYHEAFQMVSEEESELGHKCSQVLQKLVEWRILAESMRVSELIWKIYEETGIYYVIGMDAAGEIKQANLRMLAQQAAQGESRGILNLHQFLDYMKEQQFFGDQQSATLLGDQDDLVRIMTIHKSKGLQFPVVFCAGMDKNPVGKNQTGINAHVRLGLCIDYKDPEHRISRPTLAAEVFSWRRKREEMAEKVRLLYVAMTRAQEKLYMITCQQVNPIWSMPEGEGRILAAKSYTDWWMPVMMTHASEKISTSCAQAEKPYEIRVFECNQQKNVENTEDIHSLDSWLKTLNFTQPVEKMWKKSEKESANQTLVKRSVTALIKSAREKLAEEEEKEEETAEIKRRPDALQRKLKGREMEDMPEFMRESKTMTAAWSGTLTHRLLSLMSLERMRAGTSPEEVLREEKERMVHENMATVSELSHLRDAQIVSFWKSEIGRRILQAPEVHREWNFNLLIRRDQEMILQGVIDCAFREGEEWTVIDYKTDRGKSPKQLREEYQPQLQWYARAVEELTGQRVKEVAIYSLSLNQMIPVT